ncbi:hypothetical protein KQI77_09520 [Clostridium sp. MSJ-8]|uniref:hypothetical protein n=1 Tax=Clostridium sp. MSJ-8 TaxID=2841510 RepID=UPI001C0F0FA0|nr:hypothetical protein [Clostridium sp. MSJ-8]MBU5488369.1 hypothetical protein [Clostridium sp. MSJ-8]
MRKITIKYIIIFFISEIVLILASMLATNRIDNFISSQNMCIFADVMQDESLDDIISNYYDKTGNQDIEEAKDILSKQGYVGISRLPKDINEYIRKVIVYTFVPIELIILAIIYILYRRESTKVS